MAIIIVRTNPNPTSRKSHPFACSICGQPSDTWDAAKACAEADHARRTHPKKKGAA